MCNNLSAKAAAVHVMGLRQQADSLCDSFNVSFATILWEDFKPVTRRLQVLRVVSAILSDVPVATVCQLHLSIHDEQQRDLQAGSAALSDGLAVTE